MARFTLPFKIGLCASVVLMSSAVGAENSTQELLRQRWAMKAKIDALQQEYDRKTAPMDEKVTGLANQIGILQSAPPGDDQIKQMEEALEHLKAEVAEQQAEIAVAKMKDPAARAAKLKELQDQKGTAAKPLEDTLHEQDQKTEAMVEPLKATSDATARAIAGYFHSSSGKFTARLSPDNLVWSDRSMSEQLTYNDAKGNQAILISASLESKPTDPEHSYDKQIDKKYPYSAEGTTAVIEAGYFRVMISIQQDDWHPSEAEWTTLIGQLVDLDGLAALKPE